LAEISDPGPMQRVVLKARDSLLRHFILGLPRNHRLRFAKPVRQMLELTRLTSVLHLSSVEDVIQIFCSGDRAIESVAGTVA
jgi:hypothetical protein